MVFAVGASWCVFDCGFACVRWFVVIGLFCFCLA